MTSRGLGILGRGVDTVGSPHRSRISQFEFFELIILLKLGKQFPVKPFEAAASQSTVPSPLLDTLLSHPGDPATSVARRALDVASPHGKMPAGRGWGCSCYIDPERAGDGVAAVISIPEMSIESLDRISRWSLEVLNTAADPFVRSRDSGVSSAKVSSAKTAVWGVQRCGV